MVEYEENKVGTALQRVADFGVFILLTGFVMCIPVLLGAWWDEQRHWAQTPDSLMWTLVGVIAYTCTGLAIAAVAMALIFLGYAWEWYQEWRLESTGDHIQAYETWYVDERLRLLSENQKTYQFLLNWYKPGGRQFYVEELPTLVACAKSAPKQQVQQGPLRVQFMAEAGWYEITCLVHVRGGALV